ncbi:hypothetical protein GCM10009557_30990 [Virgisporangium ochraceum]|uniref:Uncharacterized protein n=1 Tax=Virgisporangium ochraceum TaxID=65505 RepID=A0A8J4A552_9ACTN|nr:hypothetical protein Voc01_099950 [Virgisporangium ochraceum]
MPGSLRLGPGPSRTQSATFRPPGPAGADEGNDQGDGDDPRRVAHEILGQSHAVLVVATSRDTVGEWCPRELQGAVRGTAAA